MVKQKSFLLLLSLHYLYRYYFVFLVIYDTISFPFFFSLSMNKYRDKVNWPLAKIQTHFIIISNDIPNMIHVKFFFFFVINKETSNFVLFSRSLNNYTSILLFCYDKISKKSKNFSITSYHFFCLISLDA